MRAASTRAPTVVGHTAFHFASNDGLDDESSLFSMHDGDMSRCRFGHASVPWRLLPVDILM